MPKAVERPTSVPRRDPALPTGPRQVLLPPPALPAPDAATWRRFWEPLLADAYLFDAPAHERDEAA